MTSRGRRGALAAALLLAAACRSAPPAGPLVVLIGDSTTAGFGTADGYRLAGAPPLAAVGRTLPAASRWRRMRVLALGVPSSTTRDWAVAYPTCPEPAALPQDAPPWTTLAVRACRGGDALVEHVAAVAGGPIDTALVVLGTNDPYRYPDASVDETVANLRTIADRLRPARVLIASPFWTPHAKRAAFVEALADALAARGLLTGPDFARLRLPVDASQVHLTRGAFVAAAGLWLDALTADATPGVAAPEANGR